MSVEVAGQVAVITGGASGAGAATARLLADMGATVVVADIAPSAGQKVADELGSPHRFCQLDVTSMDQWTATLGRLIDDVGRVDLLSLNAAVLTRPPGAAELDDPSAWLQRSNYERVSAVNIDGVVFGILAALPYLREQRRGHIVVTASGAGLWPYLPDPFYTLTKHAVVGLVRALGPSLASSNIHINALCPVSIDTAMVPEDLKIRVHDGPEEIVLNKVTGLPFQPPERIAEAVVKVVASGDIGQVWLAVSGRPAYRYEFQPLPDGVRPPSASVWD